MNCNKKVAQVLFERELKIESYSQLQEVSVCNCGFVIFIDEGLGLVFGCGVLCLGFSVGCDLMFFSLLCGRVNLLIVVNSIFVGDFMIQVELELPEEIVERIDRWVKEGRFKDRGEAIRTIIALYEEREKTREFYEMLAKRSREAKENPNILIPFEES